MECMTIQKAFHPHVLGILARADIPWLCYLKYWHKVTYKPGLFAPKISTGLIFFLQGLPALLAGMFCVLRKFV